MKNWLNFAKNAGKRLFDRDDEAAPKIQQHLEKNNPGIKGLKVAFQNGIAKITGAAKDKAAVEKAVLMTGNVKGIEEVDISNVSTDSGEQANTDVQFYEIASGDSLSKIAKKFYGDANKYPLIFEANREVIEDASKIYPGQRIRIPEAEATV